MTEDEGSEAAGAYDKTHEMQRGPMPTGELPILPPQILQKPRIRPIRFGIKMALFALVLWFVLGLLPQFIEAATELSNLNPFLLGLGFALEIVALYFYSLLTRARRGCCTVVGHAHVPYPVIDPGADECRTGR